MLPQYVTWDHIIDVLLYKSIMANFGTAGVNESQQLNETFAKPEVLDYSPEKESE